MGPPPGVVLRTNPGLREVSPTGNNSAVCRFRDMGPEESSPTVPGSLTIAHGLPTTLPESRTIAHGLPTTVSGLPTTVRGFRPTLHGVPKSSPSPNTIRCPNRLPRRGYFPQPRVAASAATLGDRPTTTTCTLSGLCSFRSMEIRRIHMSVSRRTKQS